MGTSGDAQEVRWNLRVSEKLDRAVGKAAKKAGMSKSAWIKMTLTQQAGLVPPTVTLYQGPPPKGGKR